MRTNRSIMLAAVLAMAVAGPAAAQRGEGESPQDIKDQTKTPVELMSCPDDDEADDLLYASADLRMWPPNHKYQDFSVTAEGDSDGSDELTYFTTTVSHDEYVTEVVFNDPDGDGVPDDGGEEPEEEVGAGNTRNDANPPIVSKMSYDEGNTATNTHQVRSERSGRGDGRTYTVNVYAMWSDSEDSCEDSFTIEVPHDMRSSKAPAKEDKTGTTGPNNGSSNGKGNQG